MHKKNLKYTQEKSKVYQEKSKEYTPFQPSRCALPGHEAHIRRPSSSPLLEDVEFLAGGP